MSDVATVSRGGSARGGEYDEMKSSNMNVEDDLSPGGSRRGSYGQDQGSSRGPPAAKSLQQQQAERSQAREELIVKRHLFGVPPPSDAKVFEDAAGKASLCIVSL